MPVSTNYSTASESKEMISDLELQVLGEEENEGRRDQQEMQLTARQGCTSELVFLT